MKEVFWIFFLLSGTNACRDYHKSCNKWAITGYCRSAKYVPYMHRYCKRSCLLCNDECQDHHVLCEYWRTIGECERSSEYMSINCKRSCGQCRWSSSQLPYIVLSRNTHADTRSQQNTNHGTAPQGKMLQCGQRATLPDTQTVNMKFYRVVGGQSKGAGRWPWQVGLYRNKHEKSPYCGGTLIQPNAVLTAAHCRPRLGHLVKMGDYDLSEEESSEQALFVERVFIHEAFNRVSKRNDIALLVLSDDADFGYGINSVCLPTRAPSFGSSCYVTGWGNIGNNYDSTTLTEGKIPIINRFLCNARYHGKVTQQMLCAGYLHGQVDACKGDSGGPLVCETNGKFYLHGITSWGSGCGKFYSPGVYTDVSKYLDWIKEKSSMDEETYANLRSESFHRLKQFYLGVTDPTKMK